MKNLNEMFVALLFVVLASLATLAVAEENRVTTIEYENGDVYTVPENENVFVSTKNNLFIYKPYSKSVEFVKVWPTDKVDKPAPTPNPNPLGSHSWCKAHVPFEMDIPLVTKRGNASVILIMIGSMRTMMTHMMKNGKIHHHLSLLNLDAKDQAGLMITVK